MLDQSKKQTYAQANQILNIMACPRQKTCSKTDPEQISLESTRSTSLAKCLAALRRHLAIPAHFRRTLTTSWALPQLGSISGRKLAKHWASRGRASSSVGEHRPTPGRALGERWASTVEQRLDGRIAAGSNKNTPIMPYCSKLSGNA